ncbi:hypothetical protein O6P43_020916 [Quillaja saponaria]|nr:hypothetical protein O6P43_020916 [Quillaja saponaria]
MERYKLRYLERFLKRDATNPIDLKSWVSYIKEMEPRVRKCYANIIELNHDEFVKIILVDAVFIIELFWMCFCRQWTVEEKLFLKPWLTTTLRIDLLLLENQLPFFVLEKIFERAFPPSSQNSEFPSLLQLTFQYFGHYNKTSVAPDGGMEIKHFTDLLRKFHLPPPDILPDRAGKNNKMINLPTATELAGAGVKFKAGSSKCLLDLKFSKKFLEIPCFEVDGNTEVLFRNLLALEQCQYPNETYILDYIGIMDFLVSSAKDVDILVRKGIMVNNWLQGDEAANLFNKLMRNNAPAGFSRSYLRLYEDLNTFYNSPLNKGMSTLKRDYCNTAWKKFASVAAVSVVLLTVVQTIFSIISAV